MWAVIWNMGVWLLGEKTSNQLAVHAVCRRAEVVSGRIEGFDRVKGADYRHARHCAGRGDLPHGLDDPPRLLRGAKPRVDGRWGARWRRFLLFVSAKSVLGPGLSRTGSWQQGAHTRSRSIRSKSCMPSLTLRGVGPRRPFSRT